jgi:hypothetical protein
MNPDLHKLLHAEGRAEIADNFRAWAAEAGPEAQALAEEWAQMCLRHDKDEAVLLTTRAELGRTIHVVACANGYHESEESHVAALAIMVEAHR